MLESLDPDLDCHRGLARQDAGAPPGHARGGGRARHPVHHRHPRRHRRDARRPARRARGHRRVATAATATCRRSSSRTSCPSRARRCTRAPPCPDDEYLVAIALARLVLPADVHVQAPPNLSRRLRRACSTPASTTGAASRRVTARPRQPRAPVARARPAARGHRGARASRSRRGSRSTPSSRATPERWLDPAMRFPVLDRSDAEGLGRDDRRRWYSGAEVDPPAPAPGAAARRRRGRRGARRRAARPGGRRRRDRHAVLGAGPRGGGRRRGGRRPPAPDGRRRRHVGRQPQHQLHERLHVQVPVLRVLEGPAVAQPARRPLPARRSTRSSAGWPRRSSRGATEVCLQGGIHPDFDGDYYLDVSGR